MKLSQTNLSKQYHTNPVSFAVKCQLVRNILNHDQYIGLYNSWVGAELKEIRNTHAAFHSPLGTLGGMAYTAMSCFVTKGNEPWTLHNHTRDADRTKPAAECEEIKYPKADGVLSFDLLTNLQRSG